MRIFYKHRGGCCHQPLNDQHSHSSCVLNETGWEERQNLRKSTLTISMALFFESSPGSKRLKKGRGFTCPTLFWIRSQSSFIYPGHLFWSVTTDLRLPTVLRYFEESLSTMLLLKSVWLVRPALYRRKNELKFWGLLCHLYLFQSVLMLCSKETDKSKRAGTFCIVILSKLH